MDHLIITRLRYGQADPSAVNLAFLVQTERDVVRLLEQLARAQEENADLRRQLDFAALKAENEALKAQLSSCA